MIILVHSETDAGSVASRLGLAEYSYFFVLRAFRPVLERIGLVVPISDPAREVDRLWRQARARDEPCVFLSFAPPHRTQLRLACPTIPVFAWEFDTIPHEMWSGEPRNDWVGVLRELGQAIVHSAETVRVVRAALGRNFPVVSIPAPVWDAFAPGASAAHPAQTTIEWRGSVIDTQAIGMASLKHDVNWVELVLAERARGGRVQRVALDGVVYTAVFNPDDGRKNWADMVGAFCHVFRATPDATLVLKLTHHDGIWGVALILKLLVKLWPFDCRVILIHGFLPDADYARLVAVTAFTVNTSHGEGQCLPLMEAMSAGKPAVAPPHTGMADYMHEDCAFLVRSTAEPTQWPQDGRAAMRTLRRRLDVGSLEQAYRDSYAVAKDQPERYAAMSAAASERLRAHCSMAVAEERLRHLLERVGSEYATPEMAGCEAAVADIQSGPPRGAPPNVPIHAVSRAKGIDMGRLEETQNAFDEIYKKDHWGLSTDEYASAKPGMESEHARNKRFSTLIQDLIRLNDVKSVVEFGCGWWKYMADVNLTGVQYDGFDIVGSVIADNVEKYSSGSVRFHTVRDGIRMPKADMLISKDVLQHLPTQDVKYYLSLFRTNFRFMLIGNDCIPDDNLNGDTKRGGYRALRLERPPFDYPNVVVQQWECLEFGNFIVKNFCLFQGEPERGSVDGVILKTS